MDYIGPAGIAVAMVVVFVTGYRLTGAGVPYAVPVITVHKLLALAAVVASAYLAYSAEKTGALMPAQWALFAVAGLAAVVAFATGGVVSAQTDPHPLVRRAHAVAPWLLAVTLAGAFAALFVAQGR